MSEHIRIVAVIQARMGSTRLPGKVLTNVAGKPLLWHIIHRLRASRLIEDIAIATSTNPRDDAIVAFGEAQGVTVVRGPEDNVLARFARAAEILDADIIVRVSSDAPFIDAGFVDHLIASMIEENADYVLIEEGRPCAHEGVDPLSRRGLDKLMMDAADDPVAREHVTGYFKLHPGFVRIARARPYPAFAREGGRLTIDTSDDLAFVEALHDRMQARAGEASLADLLDLLDREPSLRAINAHVRQKALAPAQKGGTALIRCDGGGRFGYGHVKRMVAVARALRERRGILAHFAVNGTDDALAPIRDAGFGGGMIKAESDLEAMLRSLSPDLFLLDGREGPDQAHLAHLSRLSRVTAVIDDAHPRRLAADFAYYPPVPQAHALNWAGARTTARIGWQWSVLGLAGSDLPHHRPAPARSTLLVAMGGSDPFGLTLRVARALTQVDPVYRVRFVIGPGMAEREKTASIIAGLRANFETIEGADDLSVEYAGADVALAAFGVTAYELGCFGVPALYLCLNEDAARSAGAFEDAGMGLSLGVAAQVSDADIARAVSLLMSDHRRRRQMRQAGRMTLDARGAARIADDLAAALEIPRALSLSAV